MPHDWMRKRLLAQAGVFAIEDGYRKIYGEARCKELFDIALPAMISHARPRIMMGSFRYEPPKGATYAQLARDGEVPSFITKLREKLKLYEASGNQEMLVDALNYLILEWHDPVHPDHFFESTDRDEV